jgi:hypothetical protein
VRGFSAVASDGQMRPILTRGQKRLQKVIGKASREEVVPHKSEPKSILDQSVCAQKVVVFLRNTATPLPTFLQDEETIEHERVVKA